MMQKRRKVTKNIWRGISKDNRREILSAVFPTRPEIVTMLMEVGYTQTLFWWGIVYCQTYLRDGYVYVGDKKIAV